MSLTPPDGESRQLALRLGDKLAIGAGTWAVAQVEAAGTGDALVTLRRIAGPERPAAPVAPEPPAELDDYSVDTAFDLPEPVRFGPRHEFGSPAAEPRAEPEPWPDPLPARTRDEALLYMDLHACVVCGSVRSTWQSVLTTVDGRPARGYTGDCHGCGRGR